MGKTKKPERNYAFEVNIKWVHIMPAKSKEAARKAVKAVFRETYCFEPDDNEVRYVKNLADLDKDLCIKHKS